MCDESEKTGPQYTTDASLRMAALSYGNVYHSNGETLTPEEVIERAEKFYAFLKGA